MFWGISAEARNPASDYNCLSHLTEKILSVVMEEKCPGTPSDGELLRPKHVVMHPVISTLM